MNIIIACSLLSVGALLALPTGTHAQRAQHPDPDLFDGSVTESAPSEPMPDAGVIEAEGAGEEADAEGGAEPPSDAGSMPDAGATGGEDGNDQALEGSPGDGTAAASGEAENQSEAAGEGTAAARSFEGLDEIGGVPVNHPGADPVEPSPSTPTRSAGAPERTGDGNAQDEVGGTGDGREERSFDDLTVGGRGSEDRTVEVNRTIQLRPAVEPRTPRPPERGGLDSPQRDRAPAEGGSDIPSGL